MAYLFMDESGCLGFDFGKQRTSKYFIVTCLFADSRRPIEKIARKVHGSLPLTARRRSGVLHCSKEKPVTRQRLFRLLVSQDVRVMAICLNKRKVYTRLQDEKHVLYNYVTNILLDRIFSRKMTLPADLILVASKRETNRFLNVNFADYLNRQADSVHGVRLEVVVKTPAEEKALQVVDFVSWAIFRKYEFGDEAYYNMIKEKIFEENSLFA
ncbi:MAG: DUF3800 domain-containing protein [Candidatus Omnitrophica bacterium]|nr:DUF3800 domain-containing protein [Candidatus Omnitrophota bacterium]